MNVLLYLIIFVLGVLLGVGYTNIIKKISVKKNKKKSILMPITELVTGLLITGYAWGLGINANNIFSFKLIELLLGVLFVTFLFLTSAIDIKKNTIDKRVQIFGIMISLLNIIYHYFISESFNFNRIIIYIVLIGILTIISTIRLRKKAKSDYGYSVVILCFIINFFTYEIGTILSIIFALLIIGIKTLINNKSSKIKKNKNKLPIASYICIANLFVWIGIFLSQIIA